MVTWGSSGGPKGYHSYSRKREEYCADFWLAGRRVLDDQDQAILRLHYVLGLDWHACCRELRIDRGTFWHRVYAMEELLGRTFAELAPYALYPPSEYFAGTTGDGTGRVARFPEVREAQEEPLDYTFQWGKRKHRRKNTGAIYHRQYESAA
jgi:hypothetical protein